MQHWRHVWTPGKSVRGNLWRLARLGWKGLGHLSTGQTLFLLGGGAVLTALGGYFASVTLGLGYPWAAIFALGCGFLGGGAVHYGYAFLPAPPQSGLKHDDKSEQTPKPATVAAVSKLWTVPSDGVDWAKDPNMVMVHYSSQPMMALCPEHGGYKLLATPWDDPDEERPLEGDSVIGEWGYALKCLHGNGHLLDEISKSWKNADYKKFQDRAKNRYESAKRATLRIPDVADSQPQ